MADPRQQSGSHDAGLARPRPADDEDEPPPQPVAAETGKELVDDGGTSEEVGGVDLAERPQALVRVGPCPRRRLAPSPVSAATRAGTNSPISGSTDGRHPVRHDVGDRPVVGRSTSLHEQGEVVDVVGGDGVRRTEGEIAEVRLAVRVEQHAVTVDSTVHDFLLGRRHERPTDPTHERCQYAAFVSGPRPNRSVSVPP